MKKIWFIDRSVDEQLLSISHSAAARTSIIPIIKNEIEGKNLKGDVQKSTQVMVR